MELEPQFESEHDRIIRMLQAAVVYETISEEEAAAFYASYLEIVEEESPIVTS